MTTLLIITQGSGFSGLFAYANPRGAGTLVASVTTGGGTDPFGNVYLQGITAYTGGASPTAIEIGPSGQIQWLTAATEAGPWTVQGTIQDGVSGLQILGTAGGAGGALLDFGTAANRAAFVNADLDIATVGNGLRVKEGTNARLGTATMAGGTITVANTTVTAATRVLYARSVAGGTLGHLSRTISVGVSFTINSSSNLDTSQIAWMLVDPG